MGYKNLENGEDITNENHEEYPRRLPFLHFLIVSTDIRTYLGDYHKSKE